MDLLAETGIILRKPGGNVEHPELHGPVARWLALDIGGDVNQNPAAWDTQRRQYAPYDIALFPWLHCHTLNDIHFLIGVAKQWKSSAIGLNIEDVVGDRLDLGQVASVLKEWGGLTLVISLAWLQNSARWDLLADKTFALEIFPDESAEAKQPQACIDHAFAEIGRNARVTLMYKTRSHTAADYDMSIAHSLYTGDDVDPEMKDWAAWDYNLPTHLAQPTKKPDDGGGGHRVNIPFKRPLYPPDDPQHRGPSYGEDVQAVKWAISRAGFWRWQDFDKTYSAGFSHGSVANGKGVAGFQKAMGIQATGWYGKETHQALVEHRIPVGLPHAGEYSFDAAAALLYESMGEITPAQKVMADLYDQLDIKVSKALCIGYSMARPVYPVVHKTNPALLTKHDEVMVDCSGDVSWSALMAGARPPDPVYGFNGYGNTGSLVQGGQQIQQADVKDYIEDHLVLAFYHNPDHVNIVRSPTQVYSNGRENAPEWHDSIVGAHPHFWQVRAYKVV